jgi:transcriptional regulator with XRE-family HTH domain
MPQKIAAKVERWSGSRLRELRTAAGYSIEDLAAVTRAFDKDGAKRLGLHPQTIFQLEHEKVYPNYRSLRLLKKALGVKDWLI